jgi:hypothetical protein
VLPAALWFAAARATKSREVGVDRWRWQQIGPWLDSRAVETARENVPLTVVQRQLGHANLGITSIHPRRS